MVQRTGETRLDVEIRDAGHGVPDQIADRGVRQRGVMSPGYIARADRKSRVNRVPVQVEAQLRPAAPGSSRNGMPGTSKGGNVIPPAVAPPVSTGMSRR